MKKIILLAMLSLIFLPAFSQDRVMVQDTATTNAVTAMTTQVTALRGSMDSMQTNLAAITRRDSAQFLVVDSTELAEARAHPERLYKDLFRISAPGTNSGWVWLRFIITMVILAGILYFGFNYCATTNMCRDEAYDTDGKLADTATRPFSYARMQLFWWTMIILSCYTFFYGLTGSLAPLNPTAVALLGFGVVVLAGGKLIDKRQISNNDLGTRAQDDDASKDSFITDMLSDEHGPCIHRFQAVIFNLIFGIGYISFFISAIYGKQYPFIDFGEWQFALIGISSATYLGMKGTENDSPAQTPSPAGAVPVAPQPDVVPDEAVSNNEPTVG
jgi:hypothetical protein